MATFTKYKLNNHGDYQLTARGSHPNRKAVVTKFANKKEWSVCYFYNADAIKGGDVVDFKKLSDAKYSAEFHVDLYR